MKDQPCDACGQIHPLETSCAIVYQGYGSMPEETKDQMWEDKKYTVREVLDSLYFEEVNADDDFDGFIHITSELNGAGTKIEMNKLDILSKVRLEAKKEAIEEYLASEEGKVYQDYETLKKQAYQEGLKAGVDTAVEYANPVEHCGEPSCPECNKKAYEAGVKETKEKIMAELPKLEDHTCRFNDPPQICDCYNSCFAEIKKKLDD